MFSRLKFSQKILLAACLVVTTAFALFTLYNDYQQRNTIRAGLQSDLKAMGEITADNIQNWLSGRILLIEGAAQSVGNDSDPERVLRLLKQKVFAETFMFTYYGSADGTYLLYPPDDMPDDYDARTRPWYEGAVAAGGSTLTEPYPDVAPAVRPCRRPRPVPAKGRWRAWE